MFALEFLNFTYDVEDYISKATPFVQSVYSDVIPSRGFGVGLASGVVPGDIFGGMSLGYTPFRFSLKAYRSGEVLITTLPDTASPPSEDNPPQVIDRVRFGAYEMRGAASKDISRTLRGSVALKFIYASAGRYGWGAGGGLDASLLYSPFRILNVYVGVKNVLSSPVVWSTGRKEFALPMGDIRLRLKPTSGLSVLVGGTYSPDGRGFKPLRDGFLTLHATFWRMAVFGGFVEGTGRLGLSYATGRWRMTVGTSYHMDFGYSFVGDVSFRM
ncbi:MAG: hypothetical protein GXO29_07115 [Thermotogae bacterium]|nr:hypothetical protein [Thermotogota bacterium]